MMTAEYHPSPSHECHGSERPMQNARRTFIVTSMKLISKTHLACNLSRSKTQRQSRRMKYGLNQSAWLWISDWPLNRVSMSLGHQKICQVTVFTRRHTLQSTKISLAHLCCRVIHTSINSTWTKTFLKFLQLQNCLLDPQPANSSQHRRWLSPDSAAMILLLPALTTCF